MPALWLLMFLLLILCHTSPGILKELLKLSITHWVLILSRQLLGLDHVQLQVLLVIGLLKNLLSQCHRLLILFISIFLIILT
jgi:hypothetical protein